MLAVSSPHAAGAADAKDAPKTDKSVDDRSAKRDRGFLTVGAFGLDGCTGQRCDNLHPLLYTRLHVLFRVKKYVASGLHMAFNFLAPNFPTGGGRAELWEMLFGPEVRGLLPIKRFDLWAGFAMGYYRSYRLVSSKGHEIESAADAFGLGWGLGLDWYVLDGKLAVGGDIWVYKPFATKICTRVDTNDRACTKDKDDLKRGFGVTIAAGFTAAWFLPI